MNQPFNQNTFIYLCTILLITLLFPGIQQASPLSVYPGKLWETYNTPEEAGWSSTKLKEAQEYSKEIGSAAAIIIHNGRIVTSWGDIQYKFKAHSIRKSFLNTLYGIHVKEGYIDLDQTMADLGIDDISPLSESEKKARVIDLLKSRSGVYHPAAYEAPNEDQLRPERGSHAPDTFWYYNNWDSNTLLTIFEQETRTKIFEEFHKHIAIPLQMEHFQVTDGSYHLEQHRSIHPAYPFRMSTLDMARFGLLYLHEGYWKDRQIIPKEWIKKATTSYSNTRRGYGVGFKWTIATLGILNDLGAYYTSGYRGHRIFILPKIKTVFVHRVNTDNPSEQVSQSRIETLLEGILAAKTNLKLSQPKEILSFRNDKSVTGNMETAERASFPENIIYRPPSSEVPIKLSALLGQWEGHWEEKLHSFLIIDGVDLETVSLTLGWGTYSPWKIEKGSVHHKTKLVISDGQPKIEFEGNNGTFTFYLNKNSETIEGYYRNLSIQMQKTVTPTFNK